MIFGISDPENIGYQLKALRIALDKKQAWLSSVSEINQLAISAFETGRTKLYSYYFDIPKLTKILTDEAERQIKEHGEWFREYLALRFYTNMIDIFENDPIKQREYYEHMTGYIRVLTAMGSSPYENRKEDSDAVNPVSHTT